MIQPLTTELEKAHILTMLLLITIDMLASVASWLSELYVLAEKVLRTEGFHPACIMLPHFFCCLTLLWECLLSLDQGAYLDRCSKVGVAFCSSKHSTLCLPNWLRQ